jgi:hypothetical protein
MTAPLATSVVHRAPTPVLFLRTEDEVEMFAPLWATLEALVGLRGRRFFGAFYVDAHEYRVCVQAQDRDDAKALGLEVGVLPGGSFLRARLKGEAPAIYERIAPTFQALGSLATVDPTRPGIEFYRAHGEIDCLLPIVTSGDVRLD